MKKIFMLIAAVAVVLVLGSCSDNSCRCVYDDGSVEYINVEEGEDCSISIPGANCYED